MALTFFKRPRHKQFNYKPVFYDKAKDEREKRMKTALEETDKEYSIALRERMNLRWKRTAGARARKNSNYRLIVVLLAIGLLFYYIFLR